ncbi:Gp15 family bacteriophage protein [Anaerotruncus colihominis]|uniref:Gp15 family bacteriophage protein n=1 Tax=Anaerotruncus colihominis TaxID=169435 RepID=UPI003D6FE6E9
MSSILSQYGIRMLSKSFEDVTWAEFVALLSGLDPNTALGRIVAIRAEDDKDMLKAFTPEQRRIRNEYRNKAAKQVSKEEMARVLEAYKQAFIKMAGDSDCKN